MIKSVIFDMDGLLINTEVISYNIYRELLSEHNHEFTLENYAQNYSGRSGLLNMENIINEYSLTISIDEGIEYATLLEEQHIVNGVELKSGARELLAYLADNGCVISLATSSTRERALQILEQNDILDYFSHFTFGPELENGKPAPDIFLNACEKTGVSKENTLILEDSESGVQAALSAEIPVICVPDMKIPRDELLEKTTACLPTLNDVKDWLQKTKSFSLNLNRK